LIRAYPEFGTPAPAGQQLPEPIIQLDADNPQLWDLVTDVLTQLAALAPGRFVHLGGDEAFGLSDQFHRSFLERAIDIVHGQGKRVVGWQEASRAGLGDGDVVQYWIDFVDRMTEMMPPDRLPPGVAQMLIETFRQSVDDLPRAVQYGAGVLFSPVAYCYLDRPYAEQPTDPDQQALVRRLGLPAYGPVTLADAFDFDPDRDLAAVAPEATIAGVEAAIWCESITSEADLQFLLLPRLAGIAERGWSPAGTTWQEFAPRLAAQTAVWRRRDLTWFTAPALIENAI
jgi:hexosaminidase